MRVVSKAIPRGAMAAPRSLERPESPASEAMIRRIPSAASEMPSTVPMKPRIGTAQLM